MFNVNGTPILESEENVIRELQRQLETQGIHLFKTILPTAKDIMTTCPFHKGGQERKPSFGISRGDMICHCFACGWAGMLDEVISLVFGHNDCGFYGTQWLTKNFLTISVESRKPLELDMRREIKSESTQNYITEEELASYRFYHPYMYKRGLTNEIIDEFDIGFDSATNSVTIPVYDLNSHVVFIARRSVEGKYFHYPSGATKPVYCGERIAKNFYPQVVITESAFNTLTCWKYGFPSVALFGTGATNQYDILRKLPVKKYILALDPDSAGQRGTQKLIANLRNTKILTQWEIPRGKDLNDLQEKILDLHEIFC